MAYRRDPKGRRTTRLLVVTALSITPAIHGCSLVAEPDGEGNGETYTDGNPKGSYYDDEMLDATPDAETDYMLDGDAEPDAIIVSNPKGCFFDEGLIDPDKGTDGGADVGDAGEDDAGKGDAGADDAGESDTGPDGA